MSDEDYYRTTTMLKALYKRDAPKIERRNMKQITEQLDLFGKILNHTKCVLCKEQVPDRYFIYHVCGED